MTAELAEHGIRLHVPLFLWRRDPQPHRIRLLGRLRYRIDTVFGQPAERHHIKRLWAKDLWHLSIRFLRKVLSHTVAPSSTRSSAVHICIWLNSAIDKPAHRVSYCYLMPAAVEEPL